MHTISPHITPHSIPHTTPEPPLRLSALYRSEAFAEDLADLAAAPTSREPWARTLYAAAMATSLLAPLLSVMS